jgi:lipid II:glycine glycyltransferase (peptidoglycan interpeptide bridge formation enzyme)
VRPLRSESLGRDGYAGPLVAPDLDEARALAVLDALVESLDGPRVVLTSLFPPAWAELGDVRRRLVERHGYSAARPYPIAVKHLAGLTAASLAASYHQSHRRSVEAAKKRGVEVVQAEGAGDFLEFYDLVSETMEHAEADTSVSTEFLVEGGQALVRAGLGDLWLARLDGVPVAGVFVLRAARAACYWLGGSAKDEKALKHRPMHAIFHRAFADAIARRCEHFELGGLLTEGLRTFKMRWGAREYEQATFERSYHGIVERLRVARAGLRRGP